MAEKKDILVYAHWLGLNEPKAIGMLTVQMARGKTAFNFTYDHTWLNQKEQFLLDPDINWFKGTQHPTN